MIPLAVSAALFLFAIFGISQGDSTDFTIKEFVKFIESKYNLTISYRRIGVFLKPSIWVDELYIYNDREELLMSSNRVELTFSPIDIWNKKEINTVLIDGLDLRFTHSDSGILNWSLTREDSTEARKAEIEFPKFSVENVYVTNGNLVYDGKSASEIFAQISLISYPEGINIYVGESDFFLPAIAKKVQLVSDIVIYPDLNISGIIWAETDGARTTARADINTGESLFRISVDSIFVEAEKWHKDARGFLSGNGNFVFQKELIMAFIALKGSSVSLGQFKADSFVTDLSFEDGSVTSDNSRIFFSQGDITLSFTYNSLIDSLSFHAGIQGISQNSMSFTHDYFPYEFTANGMVWGWLKNLREFNAIFGQSDFSFSNSTLNNVSLNSINGKAFADSGIYDVSLKCETEDYGGFRAQGNFNKRSYYIDGNLIDFDLSLLEDFKLAEIDISGIANGTFNFDGSRLDADLRISEAGLNDYYSRDLLINLENFCFEDYTADSVRISCSDLTLGKFNLEQLEIIAGSSERNLCGNLNASSSDLDLRTGFVFDPEDKKVILEVFDLYSDSIYLTTVSPVVIDFSGTGIYVDTFRAAGYSGMNLIAGLDLRGDTILGFLRADSVSLYVLSLIPNAPAISGCLNLDSRLYGTLSNPHLFFRARTGPLDYGHFTLDYTSIEGSADFEGITIDTSEVVFKEKVSSLSGFLPFSLNEEIDVKILFDDVGLWPLEFLSDIALMLSGRIRGGATVRGTYKDPDFYGAVELINGAAFVKPAGQIVSNINARAVFTDDTITFKVQGDNSRGNVNISGKVVSLEGYRKFESLTQIDFSDVDYTGFEGIWANVTGHLEVEVDSNLHTSVKGTAFVNQALLSPVPESETVQNSQEIPDLEVFIDGSSGNIIFRHELAEVELRGIYSVSSFNNVINTKGELTAERGNIFYLDRSFNITEGELLLITDSTEIGGVVDFTGKTEIFYTDPASGTPPETREITIYANLNGDVNHPALTLSSDPKMSQQDIIALLTFNTTWSNITSVSTIASAVPNRAVNYLLRTKVFSKLEKALNLSVINLETQLGSSNSAKLTLAKYVTRNVYVEYTKDILNNSPADITLTYRLWKNTSFILNKDDEDIIGTGIQWIWRY
ncbi:translocation/assembly module TamB domain-containing protein [candidate division WOR-3 bacterium]|nr:translocation/assembly module TamB domain-containing protein [candidate division WOR-3 bacterium]